MNNTMLNKLKKVIGSTLAFVMIASSFVFAPQVMAIAMPTLTIGSQTASLGDTIDVSIVGTNFVDVAGVTLTGIQFDDTLLTYTGRTLGALPVSTFVTNVGNQINVEGDYFGNPIAVTNSSFLTLHFTVISQATTETNISFVGTKEINNSLAQQIVTTFNDGTITLNPVTATLSSIEITNPAAKLIYTVGDTLDLTGLVVTGHYSDSSTKIETITASNISGFDSSAPATGQVLTITVGDKTTTYTIDINAPVNSNKDIVSFVFAGLGSGVITGTDIAVEVPFGTNITTLTPTIVVTGGSVSPASGTVQNFTNPVAYTVTATDDSTKVYTVTVTVGADPIPGIFGAISATLSSAGIANNLGDATSLNYKNFSGLYFEKSVTVEDVSTKMGRITFTSALDLSSEDTKTFLQNVGEKLNMAQSGIVGLDFTGVTDSMALKGATAVIKFYGLDDLGFTSESTSDEVNAKLIAFDDDGNLVDTATLIPTPGVYTALDHTFEITVNHFTTYEIDNTAPTNQDTVFATSVSKKGNAPVTVVNASEVGGSIWFAPADTTTFVAGETMTTVSGTATSILAPATAGEYKLFVIDAAGNVSAPSTAVLTVDTTLPTVTKLGDDSVDVALTIGTTDLVFSELLSDSSKTVVENILTAGADKTLTYSWTGSTLTITATEITTFVNDVIVSSISDPVGNISTSVLLVDSILTENQTTPDGSGVATGSSTTPQIVITNQNQATTITIEDGTTNPTIDVSGLITDGTGLLPAITITSANVNNIIISIPDSTTITSDDTTWNGIIAAPITTAITLPEESGETKTADTAIEVGFIGAKLSFDKAVRILFPNQAGKRVGYERTGTIFTEITNICTADNQTTGDALAVDGDCKIDVGGDLAVWTKHFTSFATYTQTATPVRSGGIVIFAPSAPTAPATPATSDPAPTLIPIPFPSPSAPAPRVLGVEAVNVSAVEKGLTKKIDIALTKRVSGRILLQVESSGYSWYVNPSDQARYYFGHPSDVFVLMTRLGIGITNANLAKLNADKAFAKKNAGKIFLQVQGKGEAWYVNPVDLKVYYLGRPADAFMLMKKFGLGITNANIRTIAVGELK